MARNRVLISLSTALLLTAALTTAAAAQTTYTYTGAPFDDVDPPYTTSDRVTGTFTVAAPLPPNMPRTEIGMTLLDLSFTDGQEVRMLADTVVCTFEIGTDASGNIVDWFLFLTEDGVMAPDPQHLIDSNSQAPGPMIDNGDLGGFVAADANPCSGGAPFPRGANDTNGSWVGGGTGPPPTGAEIPTVSGVGAALLAGLLALAALIVVRRRG